MTVIFWSVEPNWLDWQLSIFKPIFANLKIAKMKIVKPSIIIRNLRRVNERLFTNGDIVSSSGGDVHHLHSAEAVEAVGAAALEEELGHHARGMRKWGDKPGLRDFCSLIPRF